MNKMLKSTLIFVQPFDLCSQLNFLQQSEKQFYCKFIKCIEK